MMDMDNFARRAIIGKASAHTRVERLNIYAKAAVAFERVPYSPDELDLAQRLTRSVTDTMFHGGEAGFVSGTILLPSSDTGTVPSENSIKPYVFLTNDPDNAAHYAARRAMRTGHRTSVYLVLPGDDLMISNTCVRLHRLFAEDGGFSDEQIRGVTYHEFVTKSAVVLHALDQTPALYGGNAIRKSPA